VSRIGKLALEVGKAIAIAKHERQEFAGFPITWDVAFRLRDGTEEPAEVEPVGPDGDVDLIAAEEGDGGTDAVDGGVVGEVGFEIEAEALLRAAADGHDDVLRTNAVEAFEQRWVGDGAVTVHGSYVDVVVGDCDPLPREPGQVASSANGVGHDPESIAGPTDVLSEEEGAQVLEAGEASDRFRLNAVPDEDHKAGVGDGEVRVEEGIPIAKIAIEVFECGSGGNDEKATTTHDLDGGLGGTVEEIDPKDSVDLSWWGFLHA
jgi:hypothetical protein